MTATMPFRPNGAALRRADERRLSVAIGASLVIHALTLAVLRGLVPATHGLPPGGSGEVASLQAVIAEPRPEPPSAHAEIEAAIEPYVLPPAAQPIEPPLPRASPAIAQSSGGSSTLNSPTTPEFSIGVGMLDDPAKLGPDFVARLAARFPERVQRLPLLIGTPVMSYPQAALASGAQRRVAALIMLRMDGSIEEAQLVREDPLFGPAVLEALKGARFAPAEIDGRPVPYWAIVEFVFLLGHPGPAPVAERGPGRRGLVFPRQPSVGK